MSFVSNLAYEASAGSGKTFMLVVRYLTLLYKGASPSKILALTFTNKAAREMSERIVETLEELEHREELLKIVQESGFSKEYLLAHRDEILAEFLNAHTKIMTIDSFFTQILRKFSLYASLMPDFTSYSAQHEIKLMSRFLAEVRAANKRDLLISLSLESKKRFTDIFGLLDEFYEKKEELKNLKFHPQTYQNEETQALEALQSLKKLIESCKEASATVKKAVDAKSMQELLAKSWISRETLDYRTFAKCYKEEMDRHLHTIQEATKRYMQMKEQNFFYALYALVDLYVKAKKALYQEESELGFSDVTQLVFTILNRNKDSQFLYFRLDATIEHILLDEFQDTSVIQYKILHPLIEEITSKAKLVSDGSFFFVGDVKQSIYRFRGGVSALFNEVAQIHNTKVEKLRVNYRSQKEVVAFVNDVFKEKIQNYTQQEVLASKAGGYVEVLESEELLEATLQEVQKLISLGADVDKIAILCATNGDGEEIKNLLALNKIDVVTETTTKLINQRSVKAVLEYLKYLYFGEDIYRYNFFALISKEPEELYRADFNRVTLLDTIKHIIEKYGLFSGDFHLVRFLNTLASYSDIEALLFEYERIETEAAASDLRGVRVLTVHKSKGLEYENVIVMDRLKKAPPARDSIIYEYDAIELKNVYLRMKNRSELDPAYAKALLKEQTLTEADSLNALYVAFTRARDNLFVIKKPKESSFDILSLEVQKKGNLKVQESKVFLKQEKKQVPFEELYYGSQGDLLEHEKVSDDDLHAINLGTAMHYMLEMLEDFTSTSLHSAKSMMINKYGFELSEADINDIVQRVKNLLAYEPFLHLSSGEYYKEKALRYKKNLRYIDLLVKNEDNSWSVIDYKSSINDSQGHLTQVRSYVNAIEEITHQKVQGYLVYLLKDKITIVAV
ncbi:RecB-like helicase [Sulfurimonas sp.]